MDKDKHLDILFIFSGTTHYYNLVLNKLNRTNNLNVSVLVPSNESDSIGKGVFKTESNIEFTLYKLKEKKTFYGKPFFEDFIELVEKIKPEIIVIVWPYVLSFIMYPKVYKRLKELGVKLVFKDIPFRLPYYNKAIRYFYNQARELVRENEKSLLKGILHFFNNVFLTQLRKKYYSYFDAHVDYIEEATEIFGSYGVDKEKIFIIYNSPDTEYLLSVYDKIINESTILPENSNRLIHIGRLVKWKRVDMLIKVFKRILTEKEDAELIIIGNGPEKENLITLTQELNIQNNVKFIGAVYDTELLGKYLLSSSIYVLAGMGGLSINEAMCFAKPVVCSICDGTEKKLVREGFSGKYFIDNNSESLYQVLESTLSNPKQIEEMGVNAQSIIKNEINLSTVINGYIKAFNFVTNNKFKLASSK